jgi:hypothetical protein
VLLKGYLGVFTVRNSICQGLGATLDAAELELKPIRGTGAEKGVDFCTSVSALFLLGRNMLRLRDVDK